MSVSFLDVFTEVATSQDLPCRSYAPELFFAESPADVEYAKSLCNTCPLQAECLVLFSFDAVDNAAGDLVAVECDEPQRWVVVGALCVALQGFVRVVTATPVVAE